jgi:Flp pilus assembly protein TadD
VFKTLIAAIVLLAGLVHAQTDYEAAAADVRGGRARDAIPVLQRMLAQSPSDLKARNLLGIALMNVGRSAEARAEFLKALAIDPAFHAALKNLAVDEMALGRKAEARQHFEQLLKAVPDDPVAHTFLGEMAFAAGSYTDALAHYGQLAKKGYPDPYRAGFNLVLANVSAGKYAAAIQTAEPLIREHPTAELYNLAARGYEGAGQTQQAYDSLRSATKLDPQDERNYIDLMSLCLTHENWDLSLEISEIAMRNVPHGYRVRLQRGAVFAMKGMLQDAANEFRESAKLAPESSLPIVTLGLVEMDMKKPEEAAEALRARRARDSNDYLVNWMLAEALTQSGEESTEAIAALEAAVRLNGSIAGPHVLLGKLLLKRGERERAIREFEAALKLKPDENSAAYQLAMIYRQMGNLDRAGQLMTIAQKAASAPEAGLARRQELVRIIRQASQ